MAVADILLKDEQNQQFVESLISKIASLKSNQESVIPFIFVESSSGLGKTQMAFNLLHLNQCQEQQFEFFYLICSRILDDSQDIYKVFSPIVSLFLDCCEKDISKLGDKVDCVNLVNQNLFTFGFIFSMLNQYVLNITSLFQLSLTYLTFFF